MTRRDRWILSEYVVARDLLARSDFDLVAQHARTPFAEVDLIFERACACAGRAARREFVVVEVKSAATTWSGGVVTLKQRARLCRAREFLEERTGCPCVLWLAVVSPANEITYFEAPWW